MKYRLVKQVGRKWGIRKERLAASVVFAIAISPRLKCAKICVFGMCLYFGHIRDIQVIERDAGPDPFDEIISTDVVIEYTVTTK